MVDHDERDAVRQRGSRLTRGRKFNAEELQLMLLSFLNTAPAHGYELIKRFNDISHGYYSPSPGVLYPALGQLETLGLAQVELSGKRKNYQITPVGREYLQRHAEQAQPLFAILKHAAKKMLWISQAGESEAAAADATGWLPEFVRARKAFQAALLAQSESDHGAQRRIIAVLQRATQELLRLQKKQ
ncbi:PadR family transcriptional regulator [Pusillimonas sp. SM2304]|uniref:PadR family transcriptional regulator n=1 Tax=Pusillimonas sp. SM2304 TaxID=3073241 RepID=UPI00287696EF|nr:PadR family transcriptional regulator [Pusillimonas sp. SM2304]MDS1140476.1 PadR family transcriptional regulator [Pusillimonas sp. SM2304]